MYLLACAPKAPQWKIEIQLFGIRFNFGSLIIGTIATALKPIESAKTNEVS